MSIQKSFRKKPVEKSPHSGSVAKSSFPDPPWRENPRIQWYPDTHPACEPRKDGLFRRLRDVTPLLFGHFDLAQFVWLSFFWWWSRVYFDTSRILSSVVQDIQSPESSVRKKFSPLQPNYAGNRKGYLECILVSCNRYNSLDNRRSSFTKHRAIESHIEKRGTRNIKK